MKELLLNLSCITDELSSLMYEESIGCVHFFRCDNQQEALLV